MHFSKCDAKVQTIFETCKRFTENLYIFNIASLYSIYIKDLDTYFRHKLTKMCNIQVQITDIGCKYGIYTRTLYI